MFVYKKSCMALAIGLLITATPAAQAVQDIELLTVPTVTGVVSGCIYGIVLQKSLLACLVAKVLFGGIKDRIYATYDKSHKRQNSGETGISVTCESKTGADGVARSIYILNMDDNATGISRYQAMSDFDDLVTLAAMLVTMCCGI